MLCRLLPTVDEAIQTIIMEFKGGTSGNTSPCVGRPLVHF